MPDSSAHAPRASRQARGYDAAHTHLRASWATRVAEGTVTCWRCHQVITPTEPWDLGHDDQDRATTRGPEHANRCNRAAAGRYSADLRAQRYRPTPRHPGLT